MKKFNLNKLLALLLVVVFLFAQCLVFAEDYETRDEVPEQYKWDLTSIYQDVDSWNADFDKVISESIPALTAMKGTLKSSTAIAACLKADDEMNIILENLYVYANLRLYLNQIDMEAAELAGRASYLNSLVSAAESFIEPELMAKSDRALQMYLKSPLLKDYKQYLNGLMDRKDHILTDGEEKILAYAADLAGAPNEIFDKLMYADIDKPEYFNEEGESEGFDRAWLNGEREDRKKYYEAVYNRFYDVENSLAQTLISEVKKNVFFASARKYDSAMQAALAASSIPTYVYENLVASVNDNISSLHKYMELRRKATGVDKVHLYDFVLPMIPDYDMEVKYEDANALLKESLAPLGDEYSELIDKAFNERWIDVYYTPNKYTGAFNWGTYTSHPFVLMNYDDSLYSFMTLGHELGHAMHSYYSDANNSYRNAQYTIFNAEVASITNEMLISRYLIDNASNNTEKMFLLNDLISNIEGTVFFQVLLAEYEKTIHEKMESGEGLTLQSMKEIWGGICEKYWGDSFELDEFYKLKGLTVPHFYMNFYVYKYATSMCAAYPISEKIYNGDKEALDNYIKYLKSGGSDYPVELLKIAGVDMSTSEPFDTLMVEFGSLVDQLEQLMLAENLITE